MGEPKKIALVHGMHNEVIDPSVCERLAFVSTQPAAEAWADS